MNARRLLRGLVLSTLCVAPASPMLALANRVFVSARSGNDANACDNVGTPCQTFAGAVTHLNPDGEVIVLDSGGYGPVVITQGITIDAPAGVTAFIHPPSGNAITVSAGTATVTLRGLVLNGGTSNGIAVNSVGALHVENCVINGFANGLLFSSAGLFYVIDTIVKQNSSVGIFAAPSATAKGSIDRCRLEGNGFGLDVRDKAVVSIKDSAASGNVDIGLAAAADAGVTAELNVENCLVTNNVTGIRSAANGTAASTVVRVSNSTITDNGTGLEQSETVGGTSMLLSRGNNTVEGNTTETAGSIGTYTAK